MSQGTEAEFGGRVETSSPLRRSWWFDCGSATFGLLSTYLLLVFTILIALSPIEFSDGPRAEESATIFSWLPEAIIRNGVFFTGLRLVVISSALAWMARCCVPVSCWLTVFSAMLYWSLRMENLTNGAHIFNVTNMLLLIHAAWFHYYHRQIPGGLGRATVVACYPRWVFFLCLFYLGWFHSLAGFAKIFESGLGWGNGESLQLWVNLFGWEPSPFGQLLLLDSRLTACLQTGAMLIECAGIMIIFNHWIRYAVGIGLFGFYLGVLTTFIDFGFHFNATLVALFMLPVDRWMGLRFTPATGSEASVPN